VDILDSGSLKIQYNRNRYYDYYSGRWLTHDPLGITPNGQFPNYFQSKWQYTDTLNLYEYTISKPSTHVDPLGLKEGEIEIFSVAAYPKGLGASLGVTAHREAKDCCCGGGLIKEGDVTLTVDTDAHAGLGIGLKFKFLGTGGGLVIKGTGLACRNTYTFRNHKCGSGLSGGGTQRCGLNVIAGGEATAGVLIGVSFSAKVEGFWYLRLRGEPEGDRVKFILDGCFEGTMEWKAKLTVMSVVVKEISGDVPFTEDGEPLCTKPLITRYLRTYIGMCCVK